MLYIILTLTIFNAGANIFLLQHRKKMRDQIFADFTDLTNLLTGKLNGFLSVLIRSKGIKE